MIFQPVFNTNQIFMEFCRINSLHSRKLILESVFETLETILLIVILVIYYRLCKFVLSQTEEW